MERAIFASVVLSLTTAAQAQANDPVSKLYVTDVAGGAQIDTGEKIHEMSRRSAYNAEGTVIETKPAEAGGSRGKGYSTMVYSNGTGAFFGADTRLEVKRFVQEPFTPTRTDFDIEPSISATHAYLARGTVGLCTSRLVAGSSMVYQTAHAAVTVRGRRVFIETSAEITRISMLEGEGTVRAGAQDSGGHTVRAGEQALIRRGPPGQPNRIEIRPISPAEAPALTENVALACMARRTVYFEVRERPGEIAADVETAADGEPGDASGETRAAAARPAPTGPGAVAAFYGNSASESTKGVREIVAVPVVPANLPVSFVVSPANLPAPDR